MLHINTFDRGGAAIACSRIHLGLINEGIDSQLLLLTKTRNIPASFQIGENTILYNQVKCRLCRFMMKLQIIRRENRDIEFLKRRPKGLEFFSFPYSKFDITQSEYYKRADIIHLHWVADYLDWESFFKKNNKPVVWTLHDHNPFLGGEHYEERYLGMDEEGLPIKRIRHEKEIKEEKRLLNIKYKCIQEVKKLIVVASSEWTKQKSEKSPILGNFPNFMVSFGYPTNIFKKMDKFFCRVQLRLPLEKKIILFAADMISNERKGFNYLSKAIDLLIEDIKDIKESVLFLAVGNGKTNDERILYLGHVDDERGMAAVFNAADIFIIPSLEEALGMVAVESFLCGTPVIGFPTGGINETIDNGINGILCEEISVKALYGAIKTFLCGGIEFDRYEISKVAKNKYCLKKQTEEYRKVYMEITGATVKNIL